MSSAAIGTRRLGTGRPVDALIPLEEAQSNSEAPLQKAAVRLRENRLAQVAAVVLSLLVLACMATPLFERHWAGRANSEQNLSGKAEVNGTTVEVVDIRGVPQVGPGFRREYTLGADKLGRDVFMRILQGGRVSLTVGFSAAIITVFFAVLLGTMAGYYKGKVDLLISRYFDVQWAFPVLPLAIALSTALATSDGFLFFKRGSLMLPIFIIGFVSIPYLGRAVRAQVLSVSEREFVEAARALGATDARIMRREIFPNIFTTVLTYFGLIVSGNIIFESGLSFLGVGVLPPTPSWGNIIADGASFYSTALWISFFPGVAIMLTVLCLNLVSEALEEAFDPKALGGK